MRDFLIKYKIVLLAEELLLFLLVFSLGIYFSWRLNLMTVAGTVAVEELSWSGALIYFLLATLAILFLLKFRGGKRILMFFYVLALWGGLEIVLSFWLNNFLSVMAAILLLVIRKFYQKIWLHNLIMVLVLSGIGGSFGNSLNPWTAVLILFILSVYDVVAVYGTKHMVAMAKGLMERGVIIALIIPEKILKWKADLSEIKVGQDFVIMGGGDFALPLILAAAAANFNILNALIVSLFSFVGVIITHFIFVRPQKPTPIPALPPIALLGIAGFFISFFIF